MTVFPSLSGKTSIRTKLNDLLRRIQGDKSFHPFQGRPPFGHIRQISYVVLRAVCFHPFQGRPPFGQIPLLVESILEGMMVSIPFREDLHSDETARIALIIYHIACFHPFQGRPLFGLLTLPHIAADKKKLFPSLSGKTSIRTIGDRVFEETDQPVSFHPFQGRPLFGQFALEGSNVYKVFVFPSLSGKTSIRTF